MIIQNLLMDGQITEFVVDGPSDADEIINIIKDKYSTISKYVLWNFLAGDVSGLTLDDMHRITRVAKEHSVHEKTAFLGASDFVFGILRMYETLSELEGVPLDMQVFRDRNEAIEWLKE